jgi:hypothetical protein
MDLSSFFELDVQRFCIFQPMNFTYLTANFSVRDSNCSIFTNRTLHDGGGPDQFILPGSSVDDFRIEEPFIVSLSAVGNMGAYYFSGLANRSDPKYDAFCEARFVKVFNETGLINTTCTMEVVEKCRQSGPDGVAIIAFCLAAGIATVIIVVVVIWCCRRWNKVKREEKAIIVGSGQVLVTVDGLDQPALYTTGESGQARVQERPEDGHVIFFKRGSVESFTSTASSPE